MNAIEHVRRLEHKRTVQRQKRLALEQPKQKQKPGSSMTR